MDLEKILDVAEKITILEFAMLEMMLPRLSEKQMMMMELFQKRYQAGRKIKNPNSHFCYWD